VLLVAAVLAMLLLLLRSCVDDLWESWSNVVLLVWSGKGLSLSVCG
jgi:hypothetical protein